MSSTSTFGASGGGNVAGGGLFSQEGLAAMMDNPMVQAMLGDENMIQSMLENHPGLRRIAESNPEIGQALRNPQLMREMLQTMRNPAARAEMQRNADRALLSIENHPEGWRMLQSLYRQLDDPLDEAHASFSSSGNTASDSSTTSTTPTRIDSATPNTTALPNPWAPRGAFELPTNILSLPPSSLLISPLFNLFHICGLSCIFLPHLMDIQSVLIILVSPSLITDLTCFFCFFIVCVRVIR